MKTQSLVLTGLALVVASALAVIFFTRPSTQNAAQRANPQTIGDSAAKVIPPRQPLVTHPVADTTVAQIPENAPSQTEKEPNGNSAKPAQTNRPGKEPLKDPVAREALTLVGLDPEAEAYWVAAINDLTLPAHEREDLIEDLNEEGLPDPKHPTIDDLPLILSRLELIEAIGPDAADKVNADAFMEAYKDLLNLAELAMGGGEPVR